MIEIAFPVVARGFTSAPRFARPRMPYLPLIVLAGLAIWSCMAAVSDQMLYAEIFSRW
jgi:hypothetical protein